MSPLWWRTPIRLLRWPSIFGAVLAAALLLGVASAAGPLLVSSIANATLARELRVQSPESAGLFVSTFGFALPGEFDRADETLRNTVADRIEELGPPITTLTTNQVRLVRGAREAAVRLFARDRALDNVRVVDEVGGDGVWIAQSTAQQLGVTAGDRLPLAYGDAVEDVRIAGVYQDLARAPLTDYWLPMTFEILNPIEGQPPLPPFLIASHDEVVELSSELFIQLQQAWSFPLEADRMTLPEARALVGKMDEMRATAFDPSSSLGRALEAVTDFGSNNTHTSLNEVVDNADTAVATMQGSMPLLTLGGRLVALLMLGAAAMFNFQRRRREARLLSAQGIGSPAQGVAACAEVILPIAFGSIVGWAVAVLLVGWLGPTSLLSSGVVATAAWQTAFGAAIGLVAYGVVRAVAVQQETRIGVTRVRALLGRTPWEVVVLTLAAAAYYEAVTRGAVADTGAGPPQVDTFAMLFPLLFLAGAAGLAGRLLRRLLPALRRIGARSASIYLATRRLAGAPRSAVLLVTASALAFGVLVYAGAALSSGRHSARAKAYVSVGSRFAVTVVTAGEEGRLPSDLTQVYRESGERLPEGEAVDVLAVDPATFPKSAFWDASFAEESLDGLLARLESTDSDRVPVIVVGDDLPRTFTVQVQGSEVAMRTAARVRAWPGMAGNRIQIVAGLEALSGTIEGSGAVPFEIGGSREIWSEEDRGELTRDLRDAGFEIVELRSAEELLRGPALLSLSWTFGLLQALGIAAGALALSGMMLYLESRQGAREVSYSLARRMGLSRGSHRVAIGLELMGMLLAAALVGAVLALVSSRLVLARLDPLPSIPPAPLFQAPLGLMGVLAVVVVVVSLLGAWRVQRAADRARVAEVMRLAG